MVRKRMPIATPRVGGTLLLALIIVSAPLWMANNYAYDVAIQVALNAMVCVGLNLLIGYAGQISLGHAGFFALGAYGSAILATRYGVPVWLSLPIACTLVGLLAFVIGRPTLRLKGHTLAMATLGLGIIIAIVIKNEATYTGGPDGMPVPALGVMGFEISGEKQWYWVLAGLLLFSFWASRNLIDSPFGRALRALHGSEVASQVMGVDVVRYKVAIFVLSAFFASLMGSITAHYIGFVTPNLADFFHSIELVTMVVVGGMASIYGSLIGAVLLTALPQALSTFEGWETVVFGVILMFCMIFMPKGLVPTLAARFGSREQGGD